ncbi:MAG: NAD(P)H-hydrate epimerase, partial [Miltoncostaeaceae bacterium]
MSRFDDATPPPGLEPLLDAEAQRRADARATEEFAIPSILLMERAGAEAARLIDRRFPGLDACVVVGGGNNGGDGMVVARHLAEAGRRVRVAVLADAPRRGDAGTMTQIAERIGIPIDSADDGLPSGGLLVDALLGTGARGAPRGDHAQVIARINDHPGPVVSLDVPSGVDAGTGAIEGVAVRATGTVTFGADKVGLRVAPGRLMAGRVEVVRIGIPSAVREAPSAWRGTAALARSIPPKDPGGEKYGAGAVLVVGGSTGMTGAPALAARAAFRAGGGLVVAAIPGRVQPLVASAVPEAMVV